MSHWEVGLLRYALQRLLILPLLMLLVTCILFFIIVQLPAEQRVMVYVPAVNPHLEPEEYMELLQTLIDRHGLRDPFPVQYVRWLRNLIEGQQWGYSPYWRQPVLEGLWQRAPATIALVLFAMVPSVILALVLGNLAARCQGLVPDYLIRTAAFVGWAFPSFIIGLLLMNVFYVWLGWFAPGRLSIWASAVAHSADFRAYTRMYTVDALLNGNVHLFGDALRHLVLPGITLAAAQWALLTRIMRTSLLEALRQDYVTTARAKGLRERRVVGLHARRNALLPVISAAGVSAAMLLSGVVVVESLFDINGVGRWATKAILHADVPVAAGFALFSCTVTVLASFVADILYAVVDPRVRLD